MENETTTSRSGIIKKWDEPEIRALFESYHRSSGITIKDFCKQNHISDATFFTWRKKYFRSQSDHQNKARGFLPISVSGMAPSALFAEVNGIRIYQPVTAEYLKSLAS